MNSVIETIKELIRQEDKAKAFQQAMAVLSTGDLTVKQLYELVLLPSLNEIKCKENDFECIWREHIRSDIIKTIINSCYSYVLEQATSQKKNKVACVLCPQEEYHEIGARIAHDYFLMAGFDSIFLGANTPKDVAMNAIERIKPDYVAIGVTNYYHLFSTRKLVDEIKRKQPNTIVVGGGRAFHDQKTIDDMHFDIFIHKMDEIGGLE